MKKFRYIAIFCVLIIGGLIFFNCHINLVIERELDKKDLSEIKHEYGNVIRDRGGAIKNYACKKGDLLLLGSSELNSPVEQNPIRMFPSKDSNYDVIALGRAYTQSLQHSAILASTKGLKPNTKVAFVLSLPWFMEYQVLGDSDYESNFSPYQFYKMMSNKKVSDENKRYYAKRTYEMLKNSSNYQEETIYAKYYLKNDIIGKVTFNILKPYYLFKEYILENKDKIQTYKKIRNLKVKDNNKEVKEINWEDEKVRAQKQGEEKASGNPLLIDNEIYEKSIKGKYDEIKGKYKNVNLLECKEMYDYKYFLKVCKDLNVKPLIILMPVHGAAYDHMGVTREKRSAYYDIAEKLAKDNGFDVLNLKEKEYENYYMIDTIHLGCRGWLDVDKKIVDYYNITNQS